jgi:integrase
MRGSVKKDGASWSFVVDIGIDAATGARRQLRRRGFPTRKAAEAALADALSALRDGSPTSPARMTIRRFLVDQWMPSVRPTVRATTWATYLAVAHGYVIPRLGALPLAGLTPGRLNAFYGELLESGGRSGQALAPKTVRHSHVLLHKALADAVKWGLIVRNPAASADPPAIGKRAMAVWTPSELRQFLDHVAQDRLAAMWLLFATTGMRRGEVLGVAWSAVDLDRGRLAIVQTAVMAGNKLRIEPATKTAHSRRMIALDPATVAALRDHRRRQLEERLAWGPAWQDHGLVFTREDGQPLSPPTITRSLARIATEAGLPPIRVHDLRHSYATAALGAGVPAKVISERLGHASVAITLDTYSHVSPGLDEQAANTIASLILGP